jgi:hypothetical protein
MSSFRSLASCGIHGGWHYGPDSASATDFSVALDAHETVLRNQRFLHGETNYLGRNELTLAFGRWFQKVAFVEADMLASTEGRARLLAPVARAAALPYSECHMRAILTVNPRIGLALDDRQRQPTGRCTAS